ncbi:alpha-amylase, partial [bacterium]|nr:alpha-amylase [bacterium]
MSRVKLILCIHDHQPVGNLGGVFEHAYGASYLPFLQKMESHPDIKFVLHTTGPLLEWLEANAPDYIERVGALAARGQVEIMTGGFYEPILPAIPERDARGQIELSTDYIERRFGVRPRGMWLAERVWEPGIAKVIAESGVEYVALDDYEFRLAGVPDDELNGYFMTEDEGVPLKLFP